MIRACTTKAFASCPAAATWVRVCQPSLLVCICSTALSESRSCAWFFRYLLFEHGAGWNGWGDVVGRVGHGALPSRDQRHACAPLQERGAAMADSHREQQNRVLQQRTLPPPTVYLSFNARVKAHLHGRLFIAHACRCTA